MLFGTEQKLEIASFKIQLHGSDIEQFLLLRVHP